MHTLILLVCCTGFFCLYQASGKIKHSAGGKIEHWLRTHRLPSRVLGLGCFLVTSAGLICMDGVLMGVLYALLMMMAAGCYIVALVPFRLFRLPHIITVTLLTLLLECVIF